METAQNVVKEKEKEIQWSMIADSDWRKNENQFILMNHVIKQIRMFLYQEWGLSLPAFLIDDISFIFVN